MTNLEPLLVNTAGSWADRPEAATAVPNLLLASDFVRTHTDLATMEGANEAARRAVNAILERDRLARAPLHGSGRSRSRRRLRAARALDKVRWKLFKPPRRSRRCASPPTAPSSPPARSPPP